MKNKLFMLLLIITLLLPMEIKADTASISVLCTPQKVARGNQIQCTLSGNADFDVSKIEIPYSLDSGLTVNGFTVADTTKMTGNNADGGKIEVSLNTNVTGNFTIGTFNLTVSSEATSGSKEIKFNNIIFYNSSNESKTATGGSIAVVVTSSLKSLTVNNNAGVFGPTFSSSAYSYTLTLPANTTTFGLSAESTIQGDTIKYVNGDTGEELNPSSITFATKEGNPSMRIVVTVGSGEAATEYTILVSKQQASGTGKPTLSSLTISGQTVNLKNNSNDTEEITVTLNTVSNYQIRAELSDSGNYEFSTSTLPNSCNISSGFLTCNMSGENKLPIMVVSKQSGGANKAYILSIKKGSGNTSGGGTNTNTNTGTNTSVNDNPQTGGGAAIVMGIILVLSYAATLYLYKRNMSTY